MELVFCIGIPFLLTAIGIWVQGTYSWPNYFKVTYIPYLNNWLGSFGLAVAVLLLPILGCCLDYLSLTPATYLFKGFETFEEEWLAMKKAPHDIEKLLVSEFDTIYVQTVDGHLLSCHYTSPYDNACWVEVLQIPEPYESGCARRRESTFPDAPASINVVDRIDVEGCLYFAGMDDYSRSSYILSDTGRVYMLNYGSPNLFSTPNLAGMECLFSTIGLIMGLLAVVWLLNTNKRRNMLKKASD